MISPNKSKKTIIGYGSNPVIIYLPGGIEETTWEISYSTRGVFV